MEQRQSGGKPSFGGGRRHFSARKPGQRSTSSRPAYRGTGAPASASGARAPYTPSSSRPSTGSAGPSRYSNPRSSGGARASFGGGRSSYSGGSRGSFGNSRPSFGGGRPAFGGSRSFAPRRANRGPADERIDISRFVNKAVITEEIEHFVPEHAFNDFKITDTLKKAISAKGYVTPTPIQDRSIPHTLRGVDVVGIANTGTGKTGAFLIPLLDKAILNPQSQTLIVVPTRELALQINEELMGFTKNLRVSSVCAFGGSNINRQIDALRRHQHFVIGTPGRLKDLIERRKLDLRKCTVAVLDEADRMLDMGFIHDMRTILSELPKERQTLFFSATLSPDIEKLIHEFLNEPVRISVKTRDTSKNVDQDVVRVPRGSDKFDVLAGMLKKPEFGRVLIFGRTKHGVDKLTKTLSRQGIAADSIHGNKNNNQRQYALKNFKMGKTKVLVATDVAARGLDIADVTHVINYDLPATYDDYVHRIGRTGRGEKKGIALTFIEG